jgi:hypothetical protein
MIILSQGSRSSGLGLNPGPAEYEAGALIAQLVNEL